MKERFDIDISEQGLVFVNLDENVANNLDPQNYSSFTLFWQAFASIQAVFSALNQTPCDILIDTMGVGFAYPIVKIFFPVYLYSYVHYPIVSSDTIKNYLKNRE